MQITYEQPLNEKMRTFLRLEFLFLQAQHTLEGGTVWDSRATVAGLLEILAVCARTDLKTDILKELEKHAAILMRLEQAPGVDQATLSAIQDEIDLLIDRLFTMSNQPGQELRQSEFIISIKQRSSSPGAVCDFDLPAYHYWLKRPAEERIRDLRQWLGTLDAVWLSIELIMRLTRGSALPTSETTIDGFFQKSLDTDHPCQLVRVAIPSTSPYYAEISGGKHRITVRFMRQPLQGTAVQAAEDVDFKLTCCTI